MMMWDLTEKRKRSAIGAAKRCYSDGLGIAPYFDEPFYVVNGGACVLGHPIGASGARIITTSIHALRCRGLKRGIAALCIGAGEATAVAVEVTD
jgi:acetyl-CoA acetyltransferase